MSIERRKLLEHLGAEIILAPGDKGMMGAIEKVRGMQEGTPNIYMPNQFENPSNPEIHGRTTAEEIWEDTIGQVDVVVAEMGTEELSQESNK